MALVKEGSKLTPYTEWESRKRDIAKGRGREEKREELNEDQAAELEIARFCMQLLRDGQEAREQYETFDDAWDMFIGNVWPARYPTWKARVTLNKIRSFLLFLQAIMTDQKPRVSVLPLFKGSDEAAHLLGKLMDRSWDETRMQMKIALAVLYGLIWGTGFLKITYDPLADNEVGRHEAHAIVPYRIYTNASATSIEDARFIIHVEDQTLGYVAEKFPDKYNVVRKFRNIRVDSERGSTRDLIREGTGQSRLPIENAVRTAINNVMQDNGQRGRNLDDNQLVEIAEFWFKDETTESYERQVVRNGKPQMTDAIDADGRAMVHITGWKEATSAVDGLPYMQPVYSVQKVPLMEPARRKVYPNGRVVIMAGPVVLRDIPNPFECDGFPFAMWKNVDVGAFWGQGEALNLKDPAIALNRIVSQIFDILAKIGNPMLKYKKGSGLETRTLQNKPGSIIPLDEMEALQPLQVSPLQPGFFEYANMIEKVMGTIVNMPDVAMGGTAGGNTPFAVVDSLQEAAAAPTRQKVRNMEEMVTRSGNIRMKLIQQFDKGKRPLRERIDPVSPTPTYGEDGELIYVPMPAAQTELKFTEYKNADIRGPMEFSVVPDSSLSVSPAGVRNLYMQLFDKHAIDQQALLEKLNIDDAPEIIKRMMAAQAAAAAAKGKPGPKPKPNSADAKHPPPGRPRTQAPSRGAVAGLR